MNVNYGVQLMCELFQKKFIDSVFEKIKHDTFALDILKEKLGIEIIECPYKLIGCVTYYVQVIDKKSLTRKGFSCAKCDIKMCESCKKFKSVKDKCLDCVSNEHPNRELFELSCPNCNGNLHTCHGIIGFYCIDCKIYTQKACLTRKNPQKYSSLKDDLPFHKETSEIEVESSESSE